MTLSRLTKPAMEVIKRTIEQTEDPALAYQASRWVAEMAIGKQKQRAEIVAAEKVIIDIRILGPDGKVMQLPEDDVIEGQARELPEGE